MADYISFAGASKAFRNITGKAFERIGGTNPVSQNIYQSTESVPVYQYAALRRSKSIRLVEVLPGRFDERIRCSLEEVSIDSKLRYDALSYTWGEPIFDKTLLISKPQSSFKGYTKSRDRQWYSLGVTQSLYDALLHIRREDVEVKLWADAICIDQGNLDERSSQVQLMGQIYNRAACVRVWLGHSDETSEVAFNWVIRAFAEIRNYHTVDGDFAIERYLRQTAGRPPQHDLVNDLRDQAITNALLATFSDAYSRKWWSRC